MVWVPVVVKPVVSEECPSAETGTVARRSEPSKNDTPRPPLGSELQVTVAPRVTSCPVAAEGGVAWTVVDDGSAAAADGARGSTVAAAAATTSPTLRARHAFTEGPPRSGRQAGVRLTVRSVTISRFRWHVR